MMDFSDPWVDAQLAFVTRKSDAITSPEQLKGKTVGAEAGTAEQRWLDANQEKYGIQYTTHLINSAGRQVRGFKGIGSLITTSGFSSGGWQQVDPDDNPFKT